MPDQPRRWRRPLVLLVQLGALAAAVHWLVVPRLGDTTDALRHLDDVSPVMLAVGTALGVGALVAYAQVTRQLLPVGSRPRLPRVFGVVVSAVGVNRVAPLGMAAGTAVAFRLLTREGIAHGDVAFAMAVQGVGSLFILQLLLWPSMLALVPVSEISSGLASGLAVAGGAGAVLLLVIGIVLWALLARRAATERLLVGLGRRLRLGREQTVQAAIESVTTRLDRLTADRGAAVRSLGWATLNWLADAASLWVFLIAFGADVSPMWVLVAFGVANLVSMVPITPGSLGVTETTLAIVLIGFGAAATPVFLGIAAYRVVHYWLPIPGGLLAYGLLQVGRPARPVVATAAD